ncbi:hypothetical protein EYF80_006290 [Liparis tanakae]|uniref:Uncharacterized protein n=1 Tax=Liparis tanakae TaxID=230148 RepID=A0A4Z2IZ90_9TELE|nr:hypothetical protein EYF80_006290 [Liparis tanakae]
MQVSVGEEDTTLFMIFTNSSRLLVKRGLNRRSSPTVDTVRPGTQRQKQPDGSSAVLVFARC